MTVGIYSKGTWSDEETFTEEVSKFKTDKEMTDGYYGFDVLFKEPVPVKKNETYEIRAVIRGPVSYYGEQGQAQVTANKISFSFGTSALRQSFTNVKADQFPKLIFSEN